MYAKKAWKQSLHIIALAGGSVAYNSFITQVISLNSCDIFFFILVTRMKQLDYWKIVEENFNFVTQSILERT